MSDTLTDERKAEGRARPAANGSGDKPVGTREQPAEARPFYRSRAFKVFIVILLALSIGGTVYWLHARHFESTDDAFIDGSTVPISPQVPAVIAAVHVSDNQFVHQGDLLVELDPTDYQVALEQALGAEAAAKGKLEVARTGVAAAESMVTQMKADLDSITINFNNANRDLKRYQELDQRAMSQQQLDNATMVERTAAAQVTKANAALESAQTQISSARASILAAEGDYQKAQADTHRARINLGYCRITAPLDGHVTGKTINRGMYVTSASQLFMVVPTDVWVVANFKETQLNLMRVGQKVTVDVDAYPTHHFTGTVQSIQAGTGSRFSVIPSENATGNFVKVVQRVPVKITFDSETNSDAGTLLAPGMSAEPVVRVREGSY